MIHNIVDFGCTDEYMRDSTCLVHTEKTSVVLNFWYLGEHELSTCRDQINRPTIAVG